MKACSSNAGFATRAVWTVRRICGSVGGGQLVWAKVAADSGSTSWTEISSMMSPMEREGDRLAASRFGGPVCVIAAPSSGFAIPICHVGRVQQSVSPFDSQHPRFLLLPWLHFKTLSIGGSLTNFDGPTIRSAFPPRPPSSAGPGSSAVDCERVDGRREARARGNIDRRRPGHAQALRLHLRAVPTPRSIPTICCRPFPTAAADCKTRPATETIRQAVVLNRKRISILT